MDPRIGAWCNFIALVLAGVGAGSIQWGHLPPDTIDTIKTVAADGLFLLATANVVFHFYDAPTTITTGLKRMIAPPQKS